MLIENLQREDVNPMGEARTFRALEQLGLSQRTIAERVGCTQSHISKRLSLLELPVAVQKRVGGDRDAGGISVGAALELTKLKDQPKAIAEIAKKKDLDVDRVAREVEHKRREAEKQAKVAELTASAKKNGWKIVKYDGYSLPKTVKPLSLRQYDQGLEIDVAAHRKEPCHGIVPATYYGDPDGRQVCVDPARHKPKGESALKVFAPIKPTKTKWELEQLEHQRGRKAASARRLDALPALLAKKSPSGAAATRLLAEQVIDTLGWESKKTACALLGLPAGDGDPARRLWGLAGQSEKDLVRVAVACAMARGHDRAHTISQGSWTGYRELHQLYGFLTDTGYELDEWERSNLERENAEKATAAELRAHLVAMCSRVAPNEPTWATIASTVDDELILDFLADSGDPPVYELDDITIQRQAFHEFFAEELAAAGWTEGD